MGAFGRPAGGEGGAEADSAAGGVSDAFVDAEALVAVSDSCAGYELNAYLVPLAGALFSYACSEDGSRASGAYAASAVLSGELCRFADE